MNKTKKYVMTGCFLGAVFLLIIGYVTIWQMQMREVAQPILTEEEILAFRETHPRCEFSNPVLDLNMREMEYYLDWYDYVLVEYVEELPRCGTSPYYLHRFCHVETVWSSGKRDWTLEQYLNEDGVFDIQMSMLWKKLKLQEGDRYLFLIGESEKELGIELFPHHSYYVTESGGLVALSEEEQTEGYTGYNVEQFAEQMKNLWKQYDEDAEVQLRSRKELRQEIKEKPALEEAQIQTMREEYPMQQNGNPMVDMAVPDSWGANFGTVFELYDAVITGTIVSDILLTDEKFSTMIDLGEWQGTIHEMELKNPQMVRRHKAYWVFQVDEVLWKTEREAVPVKAGDTILFALVGNSHYLMDQLLRKDQQYLWGVALSQTTGTYDVSRHAGFYVTPEGYLFSFVSGENSNRFTGQCQAAYELALQEALRDPEKAGTLFDQGE